MKQRRQFAPSQSPRFVKPERVTKSYMVQPQLNDQMREFAIQNNHSLASCVDAAFAEFLQKRNAGG